MIRCSSSVWEAGGDDDDAYVVAHVCLSSGTKDDVGLCCHLALDDARNFLDAVHPHAGSAGDVDEGTLCACDVNV